MCALRSFQIFFFFFFFFVLSFSSLSLNFTGNADPPMPDRSSCFIPVMAPEATTHIPAELPKKQTAILQGNGGELRILHDVVLPHIPPDRMMVRVVAVALNPCDFKMPYRFPSPGATSG